MRGARREHPRQWAVTDEQRSRWPGAAPARRAGAVWLSGVVARSLQTAGGYARRSRLARQPNSRQQNRNLFLNRLKPCFPPGGNGPRKTVALMFAGPGGNMDALVPLSINTTTCDCIYGTGYLVVMGVNPVTFAAGSLRPRRRCSLLPAH